MFFKWYIYQHEKTITAENSIMETGWREANNP